MGRGATCRAGRALTARSRGAGVLDPACTRKVGRLGESRSPRGSATRQEANRTPCRYVMRHISKRKHFIAKLRPMTYTAELRSEEVRAGKEVVVTVMFRGWAYI